MSYEDLSRSTHQEAKDALAGKLPWSDLPYNALADVPYQIGNITYPVTHFSQFVHLPYQIATDPDTRAAIEQQFKDNYGSMQNFRNYMILHPIGALLDLTTLLGGGEMALGKFAGKAAEAAPLSRFASAETKAAAAAAPSYDTSNVLGKTAQAMGWVSNTLDPVKNLGRALGVGADIAGGLYNKTVGTLSQVGSEAVSDAAKAGREGASGFLDAIRGKVPIESIVGQMQNGFEQAKQLMHDEYQAKFPRLNQPIDTTPIHGAWSRLMDDPDPVTGMKASGLPKTSPAVWDQIQGIKDVIDKYTTRPTEEWVDNVGNPVTLPDGSLMKDDNGDVWRPGQWQTANKPIPANIYKLDALKQSLSDMYTAGMNPKVQRVIEQMKEAVNGVIDPVAPGYAGAMDAYSDAKGLLSDIQKTFGTGTRQGVNTQLGKLSKIYSATPAGERSSELLDQLQNVTGQNYRATLAGQRMRNWLPGEADPLKLFAEGVGLKEMVGAMGAKLFSPHTLALGAAAMPRVAGYLTYGANRVAGLVPKVYNALHMPSPIWLGRAAAVTSPTGKLAADPDELAMDRANRAAGIADQ